MSKKSKTTASKPPVSNSGANLPDGAKNGKWSLLKWIAPVLILTVVCYSSMFSGQKEFTNWDDIQYVTDQPLVKSLSSENIAEIFEPSSAVMLNYHPLTVLSLAIDYSRGYDDLDNTLKIDPFVATNLLLHLLNVFLVFILVFKLSNKKLWAAVIASALFAIHPMHVESVAWISGRKDVLYGFFFLLSCWAYLKYLDGKKWTHLGLTFLFFVASALSKPMALPLPGVLLLIDLYYNRRLDLKAIAEKLPFVLFAVWIGYVTIGHQEAAIGNFESYSIGQRILFACYGYAAYLFKLIVPVNLSALYPYPDVSSGFPVTYYVAAILTPLLIIMPVYLFLKKKNEQTKTLFLGAGFYLLMILLVIQFVSVGQAIIADRYTYMSYIGPLFILGVFLHNGMQVEKYSKVIIGVTAVFILICSSLTYKRVGVWNNSKNLWADVIAQYPYEIDLAQQPPVVTKKGVKSAYKNMGDYYAKRQQYDSAFTYYKQLTYKDSFDSEVWSNLGNIYTIKGDLNAALDAYNTSIALKNTNFEMFIKRGFVKNFLNRNEDAIPDFREAIKLNPDYPMTYTLLSKNLFDAERYDEVLEISDEALAKNPGNADLVFYKGVSLYKIQKYQQVIEVLQEALKLNPGRAEGYYYLSEAYKSLGDKAKADEYLILAKEKGYKY